MVYPRFDRNKKKICTTVQKRGKALRRPAASVKFVVIWPAVLEQEMGSAAQMSALPEAAETPEAQPVPRWPNGPSSRPVLKMPPGSTEHPSSPCDPMPSRLLLLSVSLFRV